MPRFGQICAFVRSESAVRSAVRAFSPQVIALRATLAASQEALAAGAQTREEDLQRTAAFWIAKTGEQQDAADSAVTAEVPPLTSDR